MGSNKSASVSVMKVEGEQVRSAMILGDIFRVNVDRCDRCGVQPAFVRIDDIIVYDPTCRCTNLTGAKTWSWDELAKWVNGIRKKDRRVHYLRELGFDV